MTTNTQEHVLITGAGSGIGREFTKLFLKDGARVLAVSLLESELKQLQDDLDPKGLQLSTLQMDLSEAGAAERLYAHCKSNAIRVDILINNAGFACFGDVVDTSMAKMTSMIALNVVTLTQLSMLFGKDMRERRSGGILNVGSTAGMMPAVRFAGYGATKSYVNTFTYALAAELKPYGVKVTCLTPGATATKFAQSGDILSYQGKSLMKDMFAAGKAGSPVTVAAAGYRGLRAGKTHVLVGTGAFMAGLMSRLLPQHAIPQLLKNI